MATHKGKPLDDESLIDVLAESKKTSETIKKKVVESEENERKIDEIRALYKPVATRASVLFFCIVDLANVDRIKNCKPFSAIQVRNMERVLRTLSMLRT